MPFDFPIHAWEGIWGGELVHTRCTWNKGATRHGAIDAITVRIRNGRISQVPRKKCRARASGPGHGWRQPGVTRRTAGPYGPSIHVVPSSAWVCAAIIDSSSVAITQADARLWAMLMRVASGRPNLLPLHDHAVQQTSICAVEGFATMHRPAVVPHHHVANAPLLRPDIA